ncbi:MAG: tetratricopeptide repeat protein [Chlorobi bacterium]|nr:tetratricopeptide repeat protein [Chlorobiota bacterium]
MRNRPLTLAVVLQATIVSMSAQLLSSFPDRDLDRSLQATLLESSRQFFRANAMLEHSLPSRITSVFEAEPQLRAARLDIEQGRYDLVHGRLRLYRERVPRLPFRAEAYYLDGIAYFQQRRYEQAADLFDSAAAIAAFRYQRTSDSSDVELQRRSLYWSAIASVHHSAFERAERTFRDLLDLHSSYDDDAYVGLASIAEFRGDFRQALTYYDSVLVVAPAGELVAVAHLRAAQQLILLRQPRRALQRLSAAEQTIAAATGQQLPPHARAVLELLTAEALLQVGQYQQAIERYRAVIAQHDASPLLRWQAYLGIGWAELNQKHESEAIAAYRVVIDSVNDLLSLQRAQAQLFTAVAIARSGDVLTAIERFDALITDEQYPLRSQAMIERGQIEYERGQFTTAAALFERAYRSANNPATMIRALALRARTEFDMQHWSAAVRLWNDLASLAHRIDSTTVPNVGLLIADALLFRGIATCNESRYAEAIADLGQFVARYRSHPRRDEGLLWLAESYERANMVENAADALQQLLDAYPNSRYREEALYNLGWAQFRLRRFADATVIFDRLLSEFPRSRYAMDVTLRKADIAYLSKKYADAARLYRQVAKATPTSDDGEYASFQIGQSLYRLGDYNNAAEQFRSFVRTFPESAIADDALYNIAWIRMLQGRWSDATTMLETLLRSYSQSELAPYARFYIAQCAYNSGQYVRAIDLYRQFLADYPSSSLAGQAIEAIQDAYINLGQDSLAIEVAREFVEKNPASEQSAQVLLRTTDIFVRDRNYEAAIREYERFLEQYPDSRHVPEALYGLLKSALAIGHQEQAERVLTRLEQQYPNSEFTELALLDVASALADRAFTQRADSLFAIIMNRYPGGQSFAKAAFERGRLALARGDTATAIALLRSASAAQGEYAYQARYRLGMWYRDRAQNDSARAMFRAIIAYTDNPTLAAESAYRIAELWQREGNCAAAADTFALVLDRFEGIEDWYSLSLLGLAECSEVLGNIDKARQLYQTLMILRPDDDYGRTAAARRRRLEKRR